MSNTLDLDGPDTVHQFEPAHRPPADPGKLSVGVFGAGIAGLTAAHELAQRGFDVTVYEAAEDSRYTLEKEWLRKNRLAGDLKSDKRRGWRRVVPKVPVQLGGLAASQYTSPSEHDTNENARLFDPKPAGREENRNGTAAAPLVGEHGFRFFPAYYLHLWDLLQQIPVYDLHHNRRPVAAASRLPKGVTALTDIPTTSRTVYDNVVRTVTQGMTTPDGAPSIVVPRESPRSLVEYLSTLYAMKHTGYKQSDVMTFMGRVIRYMVTSPERRYAEYEDMTAFDFLIGARSPGERDFHYELNFLKQIRQMPRVLAAYDSKWGDARTIMTTWVQLNLLLDRRDAKGDGVMNGPTTEAWFDHWYIYLRRELGVKFEHAKLDKFDFRFARPAHFPKDKADSGEAKTAANRIEDAWPEKANKGERAKELPMDAVTLDKTDKRFGLRVKQGLGGLLAFVTKLDEAGGAKEQPKYHDYYVLATSAHAAHEVTKGIREDSALSLQRLKGFVHQKPNERAPNDGEPAHGGSGDRKNIYALDEIGVQPWDRFQTLSGIQFFFEVPLQLVRGHIYYNSSPWALSSICQQVHWEERPTLEADGYATVMSVDIGDWNKKVKLEELEGEWSAKDLLLREPYVEQIADLFGVETEDLLSYAEGQDDHLKQANEVLKKRPERRGLNLLATEVWRQITSELDLHYAGSAEDVLPKPKWFVLDRHIKLSGRQTENRAPYLVPIVSDFKNRPSRYPFNPHGGSLRLVGEQRPLGEEGNSWQAPHGGYEVHHGCLVTAGTWTKTFTRITSMEAACESGRHAVHAILDHLLELDHQADYREQIEDQYRHDGKDAKDVPPEVWAQYKPRRHNPLQWRSPYDWLDQTFSSPTRQPTRRGDYSLIIDPENREDAEYRPARHLDGSYYRNGQDHPWRSTGVDLLASHASYKGSYGGPYELFPLAGTYAPVGLLTDTLKAQSNLWGTHE